MVRYDFIEWDEEDDPEGNVRHIAANGVTPAEFEQVLDGSGREGVSRSSGRPFKRGWTEGGKYIQIVYELNDDDGFLLLRPFTAYEVEPP